MSSIVDDKSSHCVPFILERLKAHRQAAAARVEQPAPFFIGLQGVQGAGKTTLVETLSHTLSSLPHSLRCAVLSIDDLYLSHDEQSTLAQEHPDNPLVQHRGQPSTHDIQLGSTLFRAIRKRENNIKLPSYDKSAFNGQGDRRSSGTWSIVNKQGEQPVEVIIFEGWCVGFRALSEQLLRAKWERARHMLKQDPSYNGQLGRVSFDSIKFVNDSLKHYDILTDQLACFIQIDAEDTFYVYDWRLQQEQALRQSKGNGMTDEQVHNFVNGYYPAYELYSDVLRKGIFEDQGHQLRLVVNKERRVIAVHEL